MRERPREELARHDREERRQDRVRRLRHRQDVGSAFDLGSGIAACHNGRAGLVQSVGGIDHDRQALVARSDRPDRKECVHRGDRPVGEIGCGQRLGRDAAGLRQLQGHLTRGPELDAASDHVHPAHVGERDRDVGHCAFEGLERLRQLFGHAAQAGADLGASARSPAREQRKRGQRVEERLRRSDGALRAGRERQRRIRRLRETGGFPVRDRDGERTPRTRTFDVLDHVRCLARLRECNDHRVGEIELRVVVHGQRDRVAHRGPARQQAERVDAVRRRGVGGAVADETHDRGGPVHHRLRHGGKLRLVFEQPKERCRLLPDLAAEQLARGVRVGLRNGGRRHQ